MKSVAFAGLGAMGKPIVKNLLQAGYSVTVFDICQEVVQELISQGAQGGSKPQKKLPVAKTLYSCHYPMR